MKYVLILVLITSLFGCKSKPDRQYNRSDVDNLANEYLTKHFNPVDSKSVSKIIKELNQPKKYPCDSLTKLSAIYWQIRMSVRINDFQKGIDYMDEGITYCENNNHFWKWKFRLWKCILIDKTENDSISNRYYLDLINRFESDTGFFTPLNVLDFKLKPMLFMGRKEEALNELKKYEEDLKHGLYEQFRQFFTGFDKQKNDLMFLEPELFKGKII